MTDRTPLVKGLTKSIVAITDREAIERFINDSTSNRDVDQDDAQHVGLILRGLEQAVAVGMAPKEFKSLYAKQMGLRKKTPLRFNPDNARPGTPAWDIVERLERGAILHVDAAKLFSTDVVPGSSIRQCERWLKVIRPRVKAALKTSTVSAGTSK